MTDLRGDIEDDEHYAAEPQALEPACPKCEQSGHRGVLFDGRHCTNLSCEWAIDFDPRWDDPRL